MASSVCPSCNFALFNPIVKLNFSTVGLYDDARFPGRLLVVYRNHVEDLSQLNSAELLGYMQELQLLMKVLQKVTGSERVNLAILGNAVPHVHAHLIPRYPAVESLPQKSPWNDPRLLTSLDDPTKTKLIREIELEIQATQDGSRSMEANSVDDL
jgi:diadenosine tetraphosphate (Ap4A) HIT family hydrolase